MRVKSRPSVYKTDLGINDVEEGVLYYLYCVSVDSNNHYTHTVVYCGDDTFFLIEPDVDTNLKPGMLINVSNDIELDIIKDVKLSEVPSSKSFIISN